MDLREKSQAVPPFLDNHPTARHRLDHLPRPSFLYF